MVISPEEMIPVEPREYGRKSGIQEPLDIGAEPNVNGLSTASSPDYSFFYDALGRRESFDDFGIVTSYIYDSLLAVQTNSTTSPASSQNFFTSPGGDVLAYQETTGSTTNTFVPLTDVLGSTIGLVNSSGSITIKIDGSLS